MNKIFKSLGYMCAGLGCYIGALVLAVLSIPAFIILIPIVSIDAVRREPKWVGKYRDRIEQLKEKEHSKTEVYDNEIK